MAKETVLRVEMLRHFRVCGDDGATRELGRSGERLVAFLALEDRAFTREVVATALWPEAAQSHAAGSLRRTLSVVRRAASGLVVCQANRLSLATGVVVDARLQRVLVEGITLGVRRIADRDEFQLLCADLLPDWDDLWLAAARQEQRLLRLLSIEALACAELAQDRPGSALAIALLAVRDDPLRESAHRLVIQAHLAQGNLAEAVLQYLRYHGQLWDDLRLRPSPSMEQLIQEIKPGIAQTSRLQVAR